MKALDLKEFLEKNNMDRNELADMLDSSIHTVNSWFSGTRNIPKTKEKILLNYKKDNVSIQSINTEERIKKLEENYKSLNERFKMLYDQLLFFQNSYMADKKSKSS